MLDSMATDQLNRQRALDPRSSFIIQAPAGSGKTELLTQRFLSLLAVVEQSPEEIIAITFTRKAAAEMRHRIIKALTQAEAYRLQIPSAETTTLSAHQQLTLQLASNALAKDMALGWNLLQNPNRLRIFTIDSLNSRISGQMPVLAGFGANPQISEKAQLLYQQAVHELLLQFNEQPSWHAAMHYVLLHLDNRLALVKQLLIDMLGRRDQWLPYIVGQRHNMPQLKQRLEQGIAQLLHEQLELIKITFPPALVTELIALAHIAGDYFVAAQSEHPLIDCRELSALPPTNSQYLRHWQALANLLLTQEGTWRKQVNINQGFPPIQDGMDRHQCKAHKERMQKLLQALDNNEALRSQLVELCTMPTAIYSHQQWRFIACLAELLPILVAELHVIFQQQGTIDFIALGLSALQALGQEDEPTDLALYLDYQIRHLLIDEFQDTSLTQFKLIEHLTAGWQVDDGRSIFLVGDPMQSIYRFRNAEVSLFLRAQQQGIGDISLQSLTLYRNFRSQQTIIDWINTAFKQILPTKSDMTLGAVPYTAVQATQLSPSEHEHNGVHYYPLLTEDNNAEACAVIKIIRQYHRIDATSSIAILVRSRAQLANITLALQQEHINFEAVAIEPLSRYADIRDLISLTRALLHRADRLAWLSMLRAPWCGLTLADLLVIAQHHQQQSIWQTLKEFTQLTALSEDGRLRLQRIVPILAQAQEKQGRLPMSQWLEGIWLVLGGPATLTDEQAFSRIQTFFRHIDKLCQDTPLLNPQRLEQELQELYVQPSLHKNTTVHVMTIHKAKGLEFDHVILPGLAQQVANDPQRLLLWLERPNAMGSNDLILAPICASDDAEDTLYDYIRRVEKQKLLYESGRLFYVATTRAKKSLHLIATIKPLASDNKHKHKHKPGAGSFLHMLWPLYQLQTEQTQQVQQAQIDSNALIDTVIPPPSLTRLTANWQLPNPPYGASIQISMPEPQPNLRHFTLPQDHLKERHLGTLIHETLEHIARIGIANWQAQQTQLQNMQHYWQQRLLNLGITQAELSSNCDIIAAAIANTLEDSRGRWILNHQHNASQQEYALTAIVNNQRKYVIIDRTFIDNDVRWIIDYKTATPHSDESLEDFLKREKAQHYSQLQSYAQIIRLNENLPIHLGLYFPLCSAWCEWQL